MRPIALVTISLLSVAAFLLGAAAPPGLEPQAAGQPGGAQAAGRPAAKRGGQDETARSWLYLRENLAQDLARFLRNHVAEVKARAIPDPEKMFEPEPFDRLVFAGEPGAVRAVEDFAKLFLRPPTGGLRMIAYMEENALAEGRVEEVMEARAQREAARRPVEASYRLSPARARAVATLIGRHALVPIRARAKEGKLSVACSPEDQRRLAPMLTLLGAERLDGKPDAKPAGG